MTDHAWEIAPVTYCKPAAYETFMGRWSTRLAPLFLRFVGLEEGQNVLDVGCGTGVLTKVMLAETRTTRVTGVDPVEEYVSFARSTTDNPRAEFHVGPVESLPFPDGTFDATLGLLVLQEFAKPDLAIREMARVIRPSGRVASCMWDFHAGMPMLSIFWDAAVSIAPDEVAARKAGDLPLKNADLGQLAEMWSKAGLTDVRIGHIGLQMQFDSFEDFWLPFLSGATPTSAFAVKLNRTSGGALERSVRQRLQEIAPDGHITLDARALAVIGSVTG